MVDDLSAPLGKRRTAPEKPAGPGFRPSQLPLARIAFGVAALIVAGVGARALLIEDPMGGRPATEIDLSGSRNANTVADSVASTGTVTITADPEIPAAASGITIIGDDIPDGIPEGDLLTAGANGLFPELVEDTENGPIPRISPAGLRPFDAYARPSLTPATADGRRLIAIVVTGLGLNASGTQAAVGALPETVTLAFAPYGADLARTVASARADGHEVLLEVPLEPFDYPASDPGPDTLLTGHAPRDNLQKLFKVMASFGGYVGLINNMGARFTASTSDLAPMMEELGARGLGYLDDGSSNRSLAEPLASANRVPFARAGATLDLNPSRAAILQQLAALEARASETGTAIGVISALPVSVQTLAEWAQTTESNGYTIVPVSALMTSSP